MVERGSVKNLMSGERNPDAPRCVPCSCPCTMRRGVAGYYLDAATLSASHLATNREVAGRGGWS